MTVTTGMLMEGKMSTVMVTMAATPRTAIKRAMTTNVYGRRSASRTIHICVCALEPRLPPQERVCETFQQESARPSRSRGHVPPACGFLLKSRAPPRRSARIQHLEEYERWLGKGGARDASTSEGGGAGDGAADRGNGGRCSRHARAWGSGGRAAGIQLHLCERGRFPDGLHADARRESGGREASAGPPRLPLRPERSSGRGCQHEPRQGDSGRRPGETAGRGDVGRAREDDAGRGPGEGRLPGGVPAAASSESSRGRDGVPRVPDQRSQEADWPGSHTLRPRLRSARRVPARIPGADLSHHASRSRRRLPRPPRHDRQLLRALQRHPQPQAARRSPAAPDAVSPTAIQPHRRPAQRALKTVEDFTEFEQRAAYFDGDPVIATKKGVNILERGSQIHDMAEFQEILDFPPAPKLDVFGKLDPKRATPEELRGQAVFFGKGQCATCHTPPYYTDNLMHNLRAERFYRPQMINGMMATADGPIKTFPLRGVKDTPPYLHDGRLLTLDDTVEFFNLNLGTQLTPDEKRDLVAFLRAL